MSVKIGSNISSLNVQRNLDTSSAALQSTFEKLSSGLRINRASDDAAGLAIASQLKANSRIYSQALRNLNDGISLTNIAQGAIQELENIGQRQLELAEQSANGTYSTTQRAAMNTEAIKLTDEYNRIMRTTSFNGRNLFTTPNSQIRIQAGAGIEGSISFGMPLVALSKGDGTFSDSGTYSTTNNEVNSTLVADFNNDGMSDFVAIASGDAELFINRGDGTFSNVAVYSAGTGYLKGAVLDLNNDGSLDLVTANESESFVRTFLNRGDGQFTAGATYATGASPSTITTGDFNGDGKTDILTASDNNFTFSLLLNSGNGSLSAGGTTSPGAFAPGSLAAADFNRDGKTDFVFTDGMNTNAAYIYK